MQTFEDEFVAVTCPVCGQEGRSPLRLDLVLCPTCGARIDLTSPLPPPPVWLDLAAVPPSDAVSEAALAPAAISLSAPGGRQVWPAVGGWALFLSGTAVLLATRGTAVGFACALPIGAVGLALIGLWGWASGVR